LLYRDLGESSKKKDRGVEKLLFDQEKTRQEKATLFYYLLDYEILSSLSFTYPSYSWIENYWTLYEQAWEKGNPIQTVQVSD
jgi:myosin-5